MKIFLIRHGQTIRNTTPDLIGQAPDEPLSSIGEWQAKLLGERFKNEKIEFEAVYCSPYKRAMDTCKIALPQHPNLTMVEALREYDSGDMMDVSRSSVLTNERLEEMAELGMHFAWPSGESLFEVEKRASQWLYRAMLRHKNTHTNIAVFSHGMTLKALLHYILQFDHRMTWKLSLANTSISLVEYKLENWFLKTINDTKHLPYKETK